MGEVIRVFLVGNDKAIIDGLSQVLSNREGIMAMGQTSGVTEALAEIKKQSPDVVIMLTDTSITGKEIIDAISVSDETHLPAMVIMMTDQPLRYLGMAIKAGVAGLLPRDTSPDDLVAAIRKIHLWSQATCSSQEITS